VRRGQAFEIKAGMKKEKVSIPCINNWLQTEIID